MCTHTRGQRNHNPLNIRKTTGGRKPFVGERKDGTDPDFLQFENDFYGYRAALKILHTYYHKYHLHSIREIISRWAPPHENKTQQYITHVAQMCQALPEDDVSDNICSLVKAMAWIESRMIPEDAVLEEAYRGVWGG